jgi:hypothetical protein
VSREWPEAIANHLCRQHRVKQPGAVGDRQARRHQEPKVELEIVADEPRRLLQHGRKQPRITREAIDEVHVLWCRELDKPQSPAPWVERALDLLLVRLERDISSPRRLAVEAEHWRGEESRQRTRDLGGSRKQTESDWRAFEMARCSGSTVTIVTIVT